MTDKNKEYDELIVQTTAACMIIWDYIEIENHEASPKKFKTILQSMLNDCNEKLELLPYKYN